MKTIMNAQLIEKLDSRRYKYLLWQTVSSAVMITGLIANDFVGLSSPVALVAASITVIVAGIGMTTFSVVKYLMNERRINADPQLKASINNEMIVFYKYKVGRLALSAAMTSAIALFLVSELWPAVITARLACMVIIYVADLTAMVAQLTLLRR